MTTSPALEFFLYEISMTIGTSLELKKMLRCAISAMLRKMSCAAGGVHLLLQKEKDRFQFEQVFSIPRDTVAMPDYQAALRAIPAELTVAQLADLQSRLPITGSVGSDRCFTIVRLANIGVVVLLKSGQEIDPLVIKAMGPIFTKLAYGCVACLQNEELIRHRQNLEQLVNSKSATIIEKNRLLTLEIAERIEVEKEKERLIRQLQEALANVKTLSGMLPICSNCRSIRDDQGYWNDIEKYIQEHSDTLFSHGLCPNCAEKLYGGQAWFDSMKKD